MAAKTGKKNGESTETKTSIASAATTTKEGLFGKKTVPAAATATAASTSGPQSYMAQSRTIEAASTSSSSVGSKVILDRSKVAIRAWEIWKSEGCPAGKDVEHWLRAEKELKSQSAK